MLLQGLLRLFKCWLSWEVGRTCVSVWQPQCQGSCLLNFVPDTLGLWRVCRFEAVWGWALHQLGLSRQRCQHLSAVLAVPIDMTAVEVRVVCCVLLLGSSRFAGRSCSFWLSGLACCKLCVTRL